MSTEFTKKELLNKRVLGFFGGIIVFLLIYLAPISGLGYTGKMDLALSLMTVVWWATQVAQPAYVGGFFLMMLIITKTATPAQVFSKPWTGSTMWLVMGAYLIAGAVNESGVGQRIAYAFIIRFVRSWNGLIVGIFVLTFILALLIPHPWPRAFMILAVVLAVGRAADMDKDDLGKLGLAIFAASCPLSGVFLTGDTSLNPLAVADSGISVSFVRYFEVMSVPKIVAALITMFLIMFLFKPNKPIKIDVAQLKVEQQKLGQMSGKEKRTIFWIVVAIILWLTSSITGIDVGWLTLTVAVLMSMPVIGGILTPASWSGVQINVLVFLTSAMAIGNVGAITGMNKWLATTVIPGNLPHNIYLLSLEITLFAMIIHMFMGSVIAVMGITIPAFVTATAHMGISPLAISLLVFSVTNLHYILPFHNLAVLVGMDGGGYTAKQVSKLGIALTPFIFLIARVLMFWFHICGLA